MLEKNAGRNFSNQVGTMTFITLCLNGSQEFLGVDNAYVDPCKLVTDAER